VLVCKQGVVVGGVYTRDVLSTQMFPLASSAGESVTSTAICSIKLADDCGSCEQSAAAVEGHESTDDSRSEHTSVTVASSHSVSCTSTQPCSDASASMCPASEVGIPPPMPSSLLCSPSSAPPKTGILPPVANVSENTSSVATSVSAANQQCLDKSVFESVSSRPDTGWREFEEALSEEFDPSKESETKDVGTSSSSSYMPQPPRAPSLMALSTASFHTLRILMFLHTHSCNLV